MAELFEEFEFKPLTDGLGFHKKAEPPKVDAKVLATATGQPSPGLPQKEFLRGTLPDHDFVEDESPSRKKSQSISELIAALPPSLDFLDEKAEAAAKSVPESFTKPQIFYPFGQQETAKSIQSTAIAAKATATKATATKVTVAKDLTSRTDYTIPGSLPSTLNKPAPPVVPANPTSFSLPTPGTPALTMKGTPTPPAGRSAYKSRIEESLARAFPTVDSQQAPAAALRSPQATAQKIEPMAETELVPVAFNFGAAFLDAMVITGVSALFLVSILLITKVDLMKLLSHTQTDRITQIHLGILYVAVLHLYMLTSRSFFGATLGEWVFDLQLGSESEQQSTFYPLKVMWRALLVSLTGFVLLPLLSILSGRDLSGVLSGLPRLQRKT